MPYRSIFIVDAILGDGFPFGPVFGITGRHVTISFLPIQLLAWKWAENNGVWRRFYLDSALNSVTSQ